MKNLFSYKLNDFLHIDAKDDEPEQDKSTKKDTLINILESMKYSNIEEFLQRSISYKRFFAQFSSKTFTMKENSSFSYEIQIKSLICQIFSYIFSMREDFLLDNFFQYFTKHYILKENLKENVLDDSLLKEFKGLFPRCILKVREKKKGVKKNFLGKDMYNLDEVLERPFIEVLIIAFYLAHNADLEERIMGLIEKSTTQSERFFNNLKKLELLTTSDEKRTYLKVNKYMDRLKISNFTTQVLYKERLMFLYEENSNFFIEFLLNLNFF